MLILMLVGSNLKIAPCCLYPELCGGLDLVGEGMAHAIGLGVPKSLHLEVPVIPESSLSLDFVGDTDGYVFNGGLGGIFLKSSETALSGGLL